MYVQGKVALVTGGADGLGFLFAKELLKNGLKGVTIVDINASKGAEAAKALTKEFGADRALFLPVDVVKKLELEDAMKKTVQRFGNFDILINNAGIMTDKFWEKEIDINIKGLMNGCVLALEEYLPKYNSGSEPVIVNIASTGGLNPFYFMPVYSATKSAVIAIGKSLSAEENYASQKVRILTVCPGATATTLIDELENRAFTPRLVQRVKRFFEEYPHEVIQAPEVMASSMVKIIENGENGSIWIAQGGEVYQVDVPNQAGLKILRKL